MGSQCTYYTKNPNLFTSLSFSLSLSVSLFLSLKVLVQTGKKNSFLSTAMHRPVETPRFLLNSFFDELKKNSVKMTNSTKSQNYLKLLKVC